jgi:2-oxoglutarate dehydrogenase complex dehydrogenase (E1) component-like enzyme
LRKIGLKSVELPDGFEVHKRLKTFHIANRIKSIENDSIDWATAEVMALASLNIEGYNTRLVGEDSERGTFNQRHAVFIDQKTGESYQPIQSSLGRH